MLNINSIDDGCSEEFLPQSEVFKKNSWRGKLVMSECKSCEEPLSQDLPFIPLTERQLKNSSRHKNILNLLDLGCVKALICPKCRYLNQFVCININPKTGTTYTAIEISIIMTNFIKSPEYKLFCDTAAL